jgi:hypothetical protein
VVRLRCYQEYVGTHKEDIKEPGKIADDRTLAATLRCALEDLQLRTRIPQ